jgi:hypothetical protein
MSQHLPAHPARCPVDNGHLVSGCLLLSAELFSKSGRNRAEVRVTPLPVVEAAGHEQQAGLERQHDRQPYLVQHIAIGTGEIMRRPALLPVAIPARCR